MVLVLCAAWLVLLAGSSALARININTAGVDELVTLPGVGTSVAQSIIDYRQANGLFNVPEDLMKVKGIGESLFTKIKDMISTTASAQYGSATEPLQVEPQMTLEEIMAKFNGEPSIAEIQKAAVEYAMIYPDEVARWRSGARNQALMPQVKVSVDWDVKDNEGFGRSSNIEIDEGSVIVGPDDLDYDEDKDNDWGFGVDFTWKTSEYVFNSDMLRVRSESENLVELRQDIVDDVTKLYFDRRRQQIDNLLHPPRSIEEQVRNDLRLQELTAAIDALTGGYLSSRLAD
ncbi:helix-hairpin-helix domain-containing protein [bacterium]|nr:helix-hairpin-helix domain-containing protein [candidate division CSSED10-310 bacterium]